MLKAGTSIAAALLFAPALASAAEVQIAATNPVVELTVTEVVKSRPDAAQVSAGVQLRAPTASEALRQNAAKMDKVVARLRQLGIRDEDIQTSNFSLSPRYQYRNDDQPPLFLGYEVSNQVTVTLRNVDRIGATLDALVAAGANNVNGPNFLLEKDEPAKAIARKAAFDAARAQATEYARMAGYGGLKLLEVSEAISRTASVENVGAVAVSAQARKTPIEPGQVGTGVTITVKYEMTR